MPGQPLPEHAIQRLLPHAVPETELRAMHVLTGSPWSRIPALFGAWAMTFGHHVLFAANRYNIDHSRGLALIAHEAGHITQWQQLGAPRFIANYAAGLLRSRFAHNRHPMERLLNERQVAVRQALDAANNV